MSDTAHTPRVSEMPVQHPAAPETAAQSRALREYGRRLHPP